MTDSKRTELTQRAKDIIHNSHLSVADKAILEGRVPYIAESMVEMFVQVCEEDPFSIDAVVGGLKKKLDAGGNLLKLHEIIKQERQEIEDSLTLA